MHRNNLSVLEDVHDLAIKTVRFYGTAARRARIGQSLRTVYHDVAKQELSDDFQDLLDRLNKIGS